MDKQTFSSEILKYWYLTEFMSQSVCPYHDTTSQAEHSQSFHKYSGKSKITIFNTIPHSAFKQKNASNDFIFSPIPQLLNAQYEICEKYPIASDYIEFCFGKINCDVFAKNLEHLAIEKPNYPDRKFEAVSLIGLKCTPSGNYIPKTFNISPLLWGTYRLLPAQKTGDYTKLLSIADFNSDTEKLEALLINPENKTGKLLTFDLLTFLSNEIYKKFLDCISDAKNSVCWDGLMIYHRYLDEDAKIKDTEAHQASKLRNSFFCSDLLMASEMLNDKNFRNSPMQQALCDYICVPYAKANPNSEWSHPNTRTDIFDWKALGETAQMDFLHYYLDINKAPLGKWPSRFRPALMQQIAINSCCRSLPETQTIFSINGPPGTGKTTLLKEIIAGNIVDRAYKLAQYTTPDDAFETKYFKDGSKENNGYSRYCNTYFRLKDDAIKDHGILVVSNNNSAVENITKELPDSEKILKDLVPGKNVSQEIALGLQDIYKHFTLDQAESIFHKVWNSETNQYEKQEQKDIYFTTFANNLIVALSKNSTDKTSSKNCWGLISAPLGKKSNLKCYINSVLKPYINDFGENESIENRKKVYSTVAQQFLNQYQKVLDLKNSIQRISSAHNAYIKQKAEFTSQINLANDKIKSLYQTELTLCGKIQKLHTEIEEIKRSLNCDQKEILNLRSKISTENNTLQKLESDENNLHVQIINLEQNRRFLDYILELLHKPSMLSQDIQAKHFALEQAKQELSKQKQIVEQLMQQSLSVENHYNTLSAHLSKRRTAHSELTTIVQNVKEEKEHLLHLIQTCNQKIGELLLTYQTLLQDATSQNSLKRMDVLDSKFLYSFNSKNKEENCIAHMSNPWQSTEYDREREKLFFEALRLHKAFLLGSKCCLWNFKNLLLFWNEPGDDKTAVTISSRDRETAFSELLNTVFLLTPVLSTTFASVETMFRDIKNPREIGCLIIDEAGQAAPQMAVGALYRSRRAIIVGDPKQIEPVVTDDANWIKQIAKNDITRYYQDSTLSVQGFADSINNIGTYYNDEKEGKLWVGCPLIVHRRCINPMFDISNTLSYSGIMKQQTQLPTPEKEATFCKKNSGWINICGSELGGDSSTCHYVPEQGEKAWELVLKAFNTSHKTPSLFVITPFTSVKNGFCNYIKTKKEYKNDNSISKWADKCIGTVHTFQGREADQVIFLLGCDKNATSSVKWVNSNIVNVAVTRAKFRLYIIGDYYVWKESDIFCKVKSILDSYAIRALHQMAHSDNTSKNRKRAEYLLKQIPDAESFTISGEPDEQLLNPLFKELSEILKSTEITEEQLNEFHLSKQDIDLLPIDIEKRLMGGILQHNILAKITKLYNIELDDASGTGVIFCKLMEALLKKQFFVKFKEYFSEIPTYKKAFNKKIDKITLGTFTDVLSDKNCQQVLVDKKAVIEDSLCDQIWWDNYGKQLLNFKNLRNACCHSEPITVENYQQILTILFEQREFMNTLFVGNALPTGTKEI